MKEIYCYGKKYKDTIKKQEDDLLNPKRDKELDIYKKSYFNLKQALNEIREIIKKGMYYYNDGEEQGCDCDVDGLKIWEIIDKVLGDD